MKGALTSLAAEKLLKHFVGKEAYTMPATVWIGLFSTVPSALTSGVEITGGGYARKSYAGSGWAISTDATITTTGTIMFDTATADWGTVAAVGVFDALTSGNLLWFAELEPSITVNTGKAVFLSSLSLSIVTPE